MLIVTKQISLSIGHRLLNYEGPCKNIHGHNIKLEFVFSPKLYGPNPKDGFVVDFGKIKKELGEWADETFDHAMIINPYDKDLIDFLTDKSKCFIMPDEGSIGLSNPTMENMVVLFYKKALKFAERNHIKLHSIRLYESDTAWVDKINEID